MRNSINFNKDWRFAKTAQIPETLPAWEAVTLPHTWNAKDGQDGGNDYWRGTACYAKMFAKPEAKPGQREFLEFNGAAMTADVYVNGHHLAHHEGGYSTFRCDITDVLEDVNLVCVTVDNSANDRVYPQKADFTFYGGLYRDVNLICVPETHFELLKDGTPGIKITPVVSDDLHSATVTLESWQNGGTVTYTLNGENKAVESVNGHAAAEFLIENVHLWDGVNDPHLYTVTATLSSGDQIAARFGCRKICFDAEKGFFLNGRAYPLRGVSRHQDREGLGNALTMKEHREDMEIIREIGANTVRLAHYQHAQEFYDLCDEYGIIAWAEIPYITQHMPNGRQNTIDQMRDLITQCYNHPSIVCWGLSNEITASGSVTDDLLENHRILNDLCHAMDKTRPTAMANVFMLEIDSPILEIPDISSYNLYFGWYIGELEQNDSFFDAYHTKYPNRVIGYSEYGADANPRYQNDRPDKGDYSETYQCVYHEHQLKMIEKRPYLWATHIWNLFDFAADGRNEGGKHGVNQKGLVTMDRKLRKDAFYLYKAHWSAEPFVHICGRRYMNRVGEQTQIKVYSNCWEISLYVDGRLAEIKTGERVFVFHIPLTGEHTIEARCGKLSDSIRIRKAAEKDKSYILGTKGDVTNWFDADAVDPTCFSIRDTMGALMRHPVTGTIVGSMMEKARASRGDVASATAGNKSLERMMAGMSLQSLLKQAGDAIPPEAIKALNDALQKVKKN